MRWVITAFQAPSRSARSSYDRADHQAAASRARPTAARTSASVCTGWVLATASRARGRASRRSPARWQRWPGCGSRRGSRPEPTRCVTPAFRQRLETREDRGTPRKAGSLCRLRSIPTSLGFLLAENRTMPMHVGGLRCSRSRRARAATTPADLYQQMLDVDQIAPLFLKHPTRSLETAGQWVWADDQRVRHRAPRPAQRAARSRAGSASCSSSARGCTAPVLARERPLWEAHMIEGLRDGRIAMYTKIHHALVDGVSAMRLLQSVLSTDPDQRDLPPPWAARKPAKAARGAGGRPSTASAEVPMDAMRTAMGITAEAAGLPGALIRTLDQGRPQRDVGTVVLRAPHRCSTPRSPGSRRFAAQGWPLERLRGDLQGQPGPP